MSDKKTLYLVDGSSYLFRAYYALPPLVTSKGLSTGAAYGVINMIKKFIKDYKTKYVAIVLMLKVKILDMIDYLHIKLIEQQCQMIYENR